MAAESKKPLVLHMNMGSTPCRAVWMLCKALGLHVNVKDVNLFAKEHMSPDFLKINPQHSIPTLDDNGFILWEGRAIMTYLVDKYGKTDELYPKDLQKRAVINRLLYFDMVPLYYSISQWLYPQLFDGQPSNHYVEFAVKTALQYLEEFLKGNKYVTGDSLNIADLALLATVTFLEIADFDFKQDFPRISAWVQNLKKELPYYEECNKGVQEWKSMFVKQPMNSPKKV